MVKRLLVTGSSGLIGSEVCRYFASGSWKIHGIDNNQRAVFFGPPGDTRWNQERLVRELDSFEHHELDIRDRPREFMVEQELSRFELQTQINDILDKVIQAYAVVDPMSLFEPRRIQGYDETVLSAIYQTMAHLEHHTGQISYITGMRLGDKYQPYWEPANKEQEGLTSASAGRLVSD